jgi:NADH-quinone oxidoreductase subunit N
MSRSSTSSKTGLILTGGGARAAYQVGVLAAIAQLRRLEEQSGGFGTYLFMNLAAFAIVALLRNRLRSEEISAYAGLVRTSPGIVVATAAVLVSLIGLPPLAGFVAKFLVFSSLVEAISAGAERPLMLVLLVLGGVNTVISLFYYLRVLKVMTFDPPPADRAGGDFPLVSLPGAVVTALAAAIAAVV